MIYFTLNLKLTNKVNLNLIAKLPYNFKDSAGGQDSGGSDAEAGGNANSLDRKHTSTASFDQYRRKHAAIAASSSNSGDSSSLTRRGKFNLRIVLEHANSERSIRHTTLYFSERLIRKPSNLLSFTNFKAP